jgi:hypothetical protein
MQAEAAQVFDELLGGPAAVADEEADELSAELGPGDPRVCSASDRRTPVVGVGLRYIGTVRPVSIPPPPPPPPPPPRNAGATDT